MPIRLYIASVKPLEDAARFDRLLAAVPPERREKVLAFRVAGARRLSLGAGLLLSRALADAGLSAGECRVAEYGKPYFPALPDFHFSLSHSGDMALCAVSAAPVGCDIEEIGKYNAPLARRFFHPREQRWLSSLPEDERAAAFYRLWTCKESFIKAIGLGLSQPLDSFAVLPGDTVTLTQTADPRPWQVKSFREGEYFCALCGLEAMDAVPPVRVDFGDEKFEKYACTL